MLELKANPKRAAQGIVLEAQLENGLGPTASVLIQDGTLHVGDVVLCGESYGKIRTLINDKNERVKSAGPSTPVKIVGLSGVPDAGDPLEIFESEKAARADHPVARPAPLRENQGGSDLLRGRPDLRK